MSESDFKELWNKFLTSEKFSDIPEIHERRKSEENRYVPDYAKEHSRLPQERDHDRILFSTPFRRLGDKTQVFPLDSIESIRTRLTHSCEVANLARSVGVSLAEKFKSDLPENADRIIPSMLAAIGLAHDIGNPPFGHQGEAAIRAWFERNKKLLVFESPNNSDEEQMRQDFLRFEGNAQTLRVLTKLQVISDDLGLNITCGTLAALMKYSAASNRANKKSENAALHKPGFFFSEKELVKTLQEKTGLKEGQRHPLALIMEACDDIAYSVLDVEDSIKKGFLSYSDLMTAVSGMSDNGVRKYLSECDKIEQERHKSSLAPKERQDVLTQMFRVHAIHIMISAVIEVFCKKYENIMSGEFIGELVKESPVGELCKTLKKLARENSFKSKPVLALELNGYNVINKLMDYFWRGIHEREEDSDLSSRRKTPFANYVYSRISQNYKRLFENSRANERTLNIYHKEQKRLPIRYLELQLITDMISGMTDHFCIDLYKELSELEETHKAVSE